MQGIVSLAARSASRTTWSTLSRCTPGIDGTGCRAFSPSITNSGQIRSSAVSTCSRTMRRAQSLLPIAPHAHGQVERVAGNLARFRRGRHEADLALQGTAEFDCHEETPGGFF